MSILFGLQAPDAGEIRLRDAPVRFRSPIDAMAAGLGMVHQSFKLFGSLTAWENIVYGAEPRRGPFIDRRAARERVAELAERHHLAVDPDARVGDLSVGVRQRIEILKALHRDARILILDEPTAVLTPPERDALFAVLKSLASEGRTVLFVTHKLHEVTAITDRVTILRDGRTVASLRTADTDAGEIVRAMTGRNVNLKVEKRPAQPGDALLKAVDVTIASPSGKLAVDRVSLTVRSGEIVGIAGVAGNGQNELVEALVGLRNPDGGRVEVCGRDVTDADVATRRAAGLAYIPEDRAAVGSAAEASAADNLAMGFHRRAPLASGPFVQSVGVRRTGARAHPALRHPNRKRTRERRNAIGRQSAEDCGCARTRARSAGADRGAADARAGRWRDRTYPRAARRRARQRPRGSSCLGGIGRNPRAFRPGTGHVRRAHPGGPPTREGRRAECRIAHGGTRSGSRMSPFSSAPILAETACAFRRWRSQSASPHWSEPRSSWSPATIR